MTTPLLVVVCLVTVG